MQPKRGRPRSHSPDRRAHAHSMRMHRRKCTSQLCTGAAPGPACGVALVTPASHQQPSTSVESLSARPSPGLHWPRVTFAGWLRGDKAPDVLVEALALPHVPRPAAGRPALGPGASGLADSWRIRSCGRPAPTAPPPGMTGRTGRRRLRLPALAGHPAGIARWCGRWRSGAWRWRLVGVMMNVGPEVFRRRQPRGRRPGSYEPAGPGPAGMGGRDVRVQDHPPV